MRGKINKKGGKLPLKIINLKKGTILKTKIRIKKIVYTCCCGNQFEKDCTQLKQDESIIKFEHMICLFCSRIMNFKVIKEK